MGCPLYKLPSSVVLANTDVEKMFQIGTRRARVSYILLSERVVHGKRHSQDDWDEGIYM